MGPVDEDNLEDTEEDQPTVVVLKSGDLTEQEAAKAREDLQKGQAHVSLPAMTVSCMNHTCVY